MKLKKLILSGFKSFADRTEFEFDDGISGVVGPNGCGKSNVVDAVKWVLGEQSAKSLRGSEMMDVIFNGSSARRAAGSAEVTLVFDNIHGQLSPPEKNLPSKDYQGNVVSVTRKLFRSGQSEYLINKVPARLKDIREMFLDTGIGNNAYGVIEQGQVEGFLQASHDERRLIFDEAAGISKYKARKKEAIRKIERVEQNLLRLEDILAEVEKRLRSIKYQAGKARNYQTYSQRLNELRSLHLLARYHQMRKQRAELESRLDRETDSLSAINARIHQLESTRSGTEVESVDLERAARQLQGKVAGIGGQITSTQQKEEMLAGRVKELGDRIVVLSSRAEELEAKIDSYEGTILERQKEFEQIRRQVETVREEYERFQAAHREEELALAKTSAEIEEDKAATIDLMRQVAQKNNEAQAAAIRRENLQVQKQRLEHRAGEISQALSEATSQRTTAEQQLDEIQQRLGKSRQELADAQARGEELSRDEQGLQASLGQARERRSGVQSRIQALREMQNRMEGVAKGVRNVLRAGRENKVDGLLGVLGSFADCDVADARLVEAALAGGDQQIVLESLSSLQQQRDAILQSLGDGGSVEFLCLDRVPDAEDPGPAGDESIPHDRLLDRVRYEPRFAAAFRQILGRTYVVDSLEEARQASSRLSGARFVTRQGEVLEADGRVRLGAGNRGAGLIARRSELADLQKQDESLSRQIETLQQQCQHTRSQRTELEELQKNLRNSVYQANTERVETESHLRRLTDRIEQLGREQPVLSADLSATDEDIARSEQVEACARRQAEELEQDNARRQEEIHARSEALAEKRRRQEQQAEEITSRKVALAQAEEKRIGLRDAIESLQRHRDQMNDDLAGSRSEIELNRQRRQESEQAITNARREVDALYQQQEQLQEELDEVEESRKGLAEKLDEIRTTLGQNRKDHDEATQRVNDTRLHLGEADVRIENLIARAADEMNMDLGELYEEYEHDDERDWDAVAAEINELRGKIQRLGNVNLDAITEQEELEQRQQFLTQQIEDVRHSQNQLTELIRKINRESQELFVQTFREVRENFQQLFRKLFGGGKADILLSDPDDVLESGIDIVARPPGKELRNLSLLSGGEKTLTALSLLFSIFKSRPSPFCLLDEVDAALDEANTERFARLVQEFSDTSQFIVITHAKRTMSMCDVLYGVTMEDAGVSKRISVRFEDASARFAEPAEAVTA